MNDIFCFLNAYFTNQAIADCDGNTIINANDIFCFLGTLLTSL